MSDLVKRLRAYPAGPVFQPDGYADVLHLEAADRIEALEAEVERLRGVLQGISEFGDGDTGYGNSCAKIARAALAVMQEPKQ